MIQPQKLPKRVTVPLDPDTYMRLLYWADKRNMSINEYVGEAIQRAIAWENQDYPLPTLEQARLNQLIDVVAQLVSSHSSLESVVISGFDSLLGMTRGDNYLLNENEDGEIQ